MDNGILDDILGDGRYGDPDAESHEIRLPFLVPGIVKQREDRLGLGRIRLTVDVLFEDGTPWLTPLCTSSGGIANRGFFNPPRKGAVAVAFFPLGKIGPGYYLPGGWVKKADIPAGALVEGDFTRAVFEDAQWLISVDDRDGNGEVKIQHKTEGTYIELKQDGSIALQAKTGKLQSDATEAMVLGDKLFAFLNALIVKLNTHTHTGGTISGSTGTPNPNSGGASTFFEAPTGILSQTWKVGT